MESEKASAASWSIYANGVLLTVKLATGIYTGSLGVLAEFIHSLFDLIASILALIGIKHAEQPADEHHHYGHERLENISGLLQSLLIAATSILIIYEAYRKIKAGSFDVRESHIGIAVMLASLVVDMGISRYLHRMSQSTGSPALEADAYHFTTDIWSTIAVVIGLFATMLGYPIGDIIAGVLVAILMILLSVKLAYKAIKVMLDHAPAKADMDIIRNSITSFPDIKGYHSLRAREAGSSIHLDMSIHVGSSITVRTAHAIAEKLKEKIKKRLPRTKEIVIHIEPDSRHRL